jgi:CubicO group peptidase (beta-lactamase class C family)
MKKNVTLIFLLFTTFVAFSRGEKYFDLHKKTFIKDSLLFAFRFNTCKVKQFENLFSESFKFFNKKDSIPNKLIFIFNPRNSICIVPTTTNQSRQKLLLGTKETAPFFKDKNQYIDSYKLYKALQKQAENYASITELSKYLNHEQKSEIQKIVSLFDNESEILALLKEKNIPTLGLGIIKNGELKQVKVFGELRKGVTAPNNTIFNVASLTKPVTAMVALKLVTMGKLDLNEPISKYWTDSDIANDPRTKLLTTRIILSHQTGFPNWRYMNKSGKLDFKFNPGTKYQYSGEGFEYLRKVLENKFQKTINQLATELIFEPLIMKDTKYFWDIKTDSTRFAIGYDKKLKPYKVEKNVTANGADNLQTTLEDYGSFLISVLNSEGLSKTVFDDMISPQIKIKKGKHFGLGFEIYDLGNEEYALSHSGSDNGCQTIFFILPKSNQGLIIFTNIDDGNKVYEKIMNIYLGEKGKQLYDIKMK